MKLASRLGLTLLAGALLAAPTYAATTDALEAQVARVNTLTLNSKGIATAKLSDDRVKVLGELANDAFVKQSAANQLATIQDLYATNKAKADNPLTSPADKTTAQKYVDAYKDANLAVQHINIIYNQNVAVKELPAAKELVQRLLVQHPILEGNHQLRVAQAVDVQLHYNLMEMLSAQAPIRTGFVLANGVSTTGDDLTATSNQVVAGVKFLLPNFKSTATVFGNLGMGGTERNVGAATYSTSQGLSYGLGAYADYMEGSFRVAALGAYNMGTTELDTSADYSSFINKLNDTTFRDLFKGKERTSAIVSADTATTNVLVKAEYSLRGLVRNVTVTPSLIYHFHNFAASNEYIKDSAKTYSGTVELAAKTPFVPSMLAHGFGGAVEAKYMYQYNMALGADLSVMAYTSTVKQPTANVQMTTKKSTAGTETTYSVVTGTQDADWGHFAVNANVKATYYIDREFTVTGRVGYSYLTNVEQNGLNYSVSLGYRF